MDRNDLLETLRRLLETPLDDDPAVLLNPDVADLAEHLAEFADDGDVDAWYAVASVHWLRYQMLPEGEDHADEQAALDAFARLIRLAPELVPLEVRLTLDRPDTSDPAALNDWALMILDDSHVVADPVAVGYAVDWLAQAVEATPDDHPDRPGRLSNLGIALRARFERTGRLTDVDEAITASQAAVDTTPAVHPDRALYLSNLGIALHARFERTGQLADLEQAVNASRAAVEATPDDHSDRALYLSNLGNALQVRFERTGQLADIEHAINASRAAVEATLADHPDRALYLSNLGSALLTRSERTGDVEDRRMALAALRGGARVVTAPPMRRAIAGLGWAELAGAAGDWRQARIASAEVLGLLPQLVGHDLSPADRRYQLTHLQGLGTLAAHAHLTKGRRWSRRRAKRAWQALENGRGVLLNQALETRTDLTDLTRTFPDLAGQVQRLSQLLNQDPRPSYSTDVEDSETAAYRLVAQRRQWANQWDGLMQEVRSRPGFARFGLPPTPDQLQAAASDGTIVAVNITEFGCHALILTAHGADYLPLPRLDHAELVSQADRFLRVLYPSGDETSPGEGSSALREILGWLWDTVAEPILHHVGLLRGPRPGEAWPRIWWIPTGVLTVLPLHAAGRHDQPPGPDGSAVLDRVVSSYTPTVRALYHARQQQRSATCGMPLIVGLNHTPGLPDLDYAEAEARDVQQFMRASDPLLGSDATHTRVTAALPQAGWSHFACHAMADQNDPGDSYLALYDRKLHVRELAGMQLGDAYLANLSACTTAVGALDLIDEPIHIASAFQLAGCQHTIATLWPISDYMAPLITNTIYENMIIHGDDPALAVHHAVQAIRANPHAGGQPQLWASHVHFGP